MYWNEDAKCQKKEEQKIASLLKDHLITDEPPFSRRRVGVNYLGPFKVKLIGVLSDVTVWYLLVYLAIHLEVAASLDTDSYIRSDNGMNFIGAKRELTRSIQEFNRSQIQ